MTTALELHQGMDVAFFEIVAVESPDGADTLDTLATLLLQMADRELEAERQPTSQAMRPAA